MASKGQPLGEPGSIFCLRAGLILTVRFCLRRRLEIYASSVLIGITLLNPHVSYSAVAPQGFEYALPTSKRWFRAVRTLRNQPKHSILYLQPCRCNARLETKQAASFQRGLVHRNRRSNTFEHRSCELRHRRLAVQGARS